MSGRDGHERPIIKTMGAHAFSTGSAGTSTTKVVWPPLRIKCYPAIQDKTNKNRTKPGYNKNVRTKKNNVKW
jgi:hypothetical protein